MKDGIFAIMYAFGGMVIAALIVCCGMGVAHIIRQADSVPAEVEAITVNGKIDIDGTLIFEGADGQCLRMWQIPHRMEAWLMGQKNIRIEDMYYFDHRTANEPASLRYYVRYQLGK